MSTIDAMQERIVELEQQVAQLEEQLRWRSLDEKPDDLENNVVLVSNLEPFGDRSGRLFPRVGVGWWEEDDQVWERNNPHTDIGGCEPIPNPQGWMYEPAPIPVAA
jgi:hypothetical protein